MSDELEQKLFCYTCGNTISRSIKGLCPDCLDEGIISLDFGMQIVAEDIYECHLGLAYLDDNGIIWWDEVTTGLEDDAILTWVRFPANYGYIPRMLFNFEERKFKDPISSEEVNFSKTQIKLK